MLIRRIVSVASPPRLRVMLVAVSAANKPTSVRPSSVHYQVHDILRIHFAARVQHIHQNRFRAAILHAGQIRPQLEAHAFNPMALSTDLLKRRLPTGCIAGHAQHRAIGLDHILPTPQLDAGQHTRGPGPQFWIGMRGQRLHAAGV